jgi:glutathione S-transferase
MLRLHDYLDSGNGYKVRFLLRLLGTPFELEPVDILRGESRTAEFMEKNPNGRIPVLEFPDGRCLAESNAILFHLADGTPYFPNDSWERAEVMQWLFFEQYSHEPNIATPRFWVRHTETGPEKRALLDEKRRLGHAALGVMERHLAGRAFFVGSRLSIADVALYAYTHVAHEGGFDLAPYPAVQRWLDRLRGTPGYLPITSGSGVPERG